MIDINSVKGRIFDIQKYSVHDGPGIRTIVFLKGCAFRCKWCCNPESQEYGIQTMNVDGKEKIVGRDVTVGEVMEEIVKDFPYYRRSGGGVTLSGGESLLQPEFAVALLKACKDYGINTAMESTGFAPFDTIKKYLEYLDLYLMDIKHMDKLKHMEFIGKPNDVVLENAQLIAAHAKKLIIRVPVIPTFNDTEEEIRAIAQFASSLPNVDELHLLPYHPYGTDKYRWLGREYTLSHITPPSDAKMNRLLEVVKREGLRSQIGG